MKVQSQSLESKYDFDWMLIKLETLEYRYTLKHILSKSAGKTFEIIHHRYMYFNFFFFRKSTIIELGTLQINQAHCCGHSTMLKSVWL